MWESEYGSEWCCRKWTSGWTERPFCPQAPIQIPQDGSAGRALLVFSKLIWNFIWDFTPRFWCGFCWYIIFCDAYFAPDHSGLQNQPQFRLSNVTLLTLCFLCLNSYLVSGFIFIAPAYSSLYLKFYSMFCSVHYLFSSVFDLYLVSYFIFTVHLEIVCKEVFCAYFEVLKLYRMVFMAKNRYKLI